LNLYGYGLNNPYRFVDADGRIPLDTIWDLANVAYDLYTGDKVSLAADLAAMAIPYFPAGITKVGKLASKGADEVVDLVSSSRRRHILDGEILPNGRYSGGHRGGTGFPGKSEFPSGWSDDKIIHHISDIATDPLSVTRPGRGGDVFIQGTREGIDIEVLVRRGEIWTGYPVNVPRNP